MTWKRSEQWFMLSVTCCIALYLIVGLFFQLAPVSWFVEFHKIHAANEYNLMNEDIPMVSKVTPHWDTNVKYNDILRCKKNARSVWTFKGDQSTKHILLEKADTYEAPWVFQKEAYEIDYPDECYIESTIQVEVPFGVKKYIKNNSPHFYMVEEMEN